MNRATHSLVVAAWSLLAMLSWAQTPAVIPLPSAEEAERMLAEEPMTLENWPAWRTRLLAWIESDDLVTSALYDDACEMLLEEATTQGDVPTELADDYFAQYLLGAAQLWYWSEGSLADYAGVAEPRLRRCVQLNPEFARGHRRLAEAILYQAEARPGTPLYDEGLRELSRANQLDPQLPTKWVLAECAMLQMRLTEAIALGRDALIEDPLDETAAHRLTLSLISNSMKGGDDSSLVAVRDEVSALTKRFPQSGPILSWYAIALANTGDFGGANVALSAAREQGFDPLDAVPAEAISEIEQRGRRSFQVRMWIVGTFGAAALAAIGACMMAVARRAKRPSIA